jgi:hypothetical protein
MLPLVKFNYSDSIRAKDVCLAPMEHVLEVTGVVLCSESISNLQGRRRAAL